jgi:hypothetical protein
MTDTTTPPQWIQLARQRGRTDPHGLSGAISWVFHQCMTAEDRAAFDAWLVAEQHPLSFEPGTTEQRFTRLVHEAPAVPANHRDTKER